MKEGCPPSSTEAPVEMTVKAMIFIGFFTKIYVLLIFSETITCRKKSFKQKMFISMRYITFV